MWMTLFLFRSVQTSCLIVHDIMRKLMHWIVPKLWVVPTDPSYSVIYLFFVYLPQVLMFIIVFSGDYHSNKIKLLYPFFFVVYQWRPETPLNMQVNCGVRGKINPPCNAVGFIDRRVLGINHMYQHPAWRRSKVAFSLD